MIRWLALLLLLLVMPMPSHAQETPPITDQNAHRLTQSDPIGRGAIPALRWSRDGRWLAAQTSTGVWLIDATIPDAEPRWLRVLDHTQALAFSPDSDMLAIAGCRGSIRELWAQMETVCAYNETHLWALGDAVTLLSVTDNGRTDIDRLAVGALPFRAAPLILSSNYLVDSRVQVANGNHVWTLDFSRQLRTLFHVVLSPDSQTLVVGGVDSLYVVNLDSALRGDTLPDNAALIMPDAPDLRQFAFSDDGHTLIGRTAYGAWHWDVTQPQVPPRYESPVSEVVEMHQPILFSRNFERAISTIDQESRLWFDTTMVFSPDPPAESNILLPPSRLDQWSFSPAERFLLMRTGGSPAYEVAAGGTAVSGSIRLFDTTTGALMREYAPAESVSQAAVSFDDAKIAYLDATPVLHIEDIASGQSLNRITGFAAETAGIIVHPDGTLFYSSCGLNLSFENIRRCVPLVLHRGDDAFPDEGTTPAAISPDGRWLVDSQSFLRDSATGTLVRDLDPERVVEERPPLYPTIRPSIHRFAFSRDSRFVAVSGEVPRIIDLSMSDDASISLALAEDVAARYDMNTRAIAYSPDGRWVASTSADGNARLWDASTGALRAILRHEDIGTSAGDGIAFSPDGQFIAFGRCYGLTGSNTTCTDERIYVYAVALAVTRSDLRPSEATHILMGATTYADQVLFSPDGSVIVASGAGEVVVWSARTGAILSILPAYGAKEIAFSPDGRILYGSSTVGVVYRWRVADSTP